MSLEGNLPPAAARQRGGRLVAAALVAIVIAVSAFSAGWMMRRAPDAVYDAPHPTGHLVAYVTEARCAPGPVSGAQDPHNIRQRAAR